MAMSRSRGGRLFTTRSPMRTSPLVMSSSPAIMRSAVVLPQPDGPTRQTNSPSLISRFSLLTASAPPSYRLVRSSRTTPDMTRSSFDRPGEHASDEKSLEGKEDDQWDDYGDHPSSRDDPVVGCEETRLTVEEQRERLVGVVGQEYQRHQQVVPHPDELEDRKGRGGRQAERQHHSAEEGPLAGSVDP